VQRHSKTPNAHRHTERPEKKFLGKMLSDVSVSTFNATESKYFENLDLVAVLLSDSTVKIRREEDLVLSEEEARCSRAPPTRGCCYH